MIGRWSRFCEVLAKALFVLANTAAGQEVMLYEEARTPQTTIASRTDSSQIHADSTTVAPISISSASQRLRQRIDAGYHTPSIHPYFRNDQRAINDMRRLVFLVDKAAVRGVESIPELVAIARKLPVAKQTAIIRFAAAGSVANFAAENAMKHLRRHKIDFVQMEVERVLCQTTLHGMHLSVSRSLDKQIYTVGVPKLRATYSRAAHSKFVSHFVHFAPLPRLGLNYIRWGEADIFSSFHALKGGFGLVSHDYTRSVTLLGLRLQENKNWLGVFFIKNHRVPAGSWLRFDMWLVR